MFGFDKKKRRYGWKPDLPDHRDLMFSVDYVDSASLPTAVDLRSYCPPVYNQGNQGSCTGNAIGAAIQFGLCKQDKVKAFMPSRDFIYYFEREMEGNVMSDSGAQIRDGIKVVNAYGVCDEKTWPYSSWRMFIKPSKAAQAAARLHRALVYRRLNNLNILELESCLASGYPFVFGFSVYDSFEGDYVARTGVVNLPGMGESVMGGHAVMAVGYDRNTRRFIVRNSWGAGWGLGGYFTMPYEYVTNGNLACDFWTIKSVS
jgi:C1A family cysteine protease